MGEHDDLVQALAARVAAAMEMARQAIERAEVLGEFVREFRDRETVVVRCAWCGRFQLNDRYLDVEQHLDEGVPERLRERSSHGTCPECFARVQARATAERGA